MNPETLAAVSSAVQATAREMPGRLARVRARAGAVVVDVSWGGDPVATTAAGAGPAAARPVAAEQPGDVPRGIVFAAPAGGTFYRAASPGADPFVRVGDAIEDGTQIGIIEAMKLMTPTLVDVGGVVAEILVADAEIVQYGQPLLVIHPRHR